jgi:hypothetical protein
MKNSVLEQLCLKHGFKLFTPPSREDKLKKDFDFVISRIRRFVKDNNYLWTLEISDAKSGACKYATSDKRYLARQIFYQFVGAAGILGAESVNIGYYINAVTGMSSKQVCKDHVIPPQMLGEYLLDKMFGFYTEKDPYVLDDLETWIRCCFKVCSVTKRINNLLSHHSCYHKSSLNNPNDYIPLVTSEKYQYLNENETGVKNCYDFMGNLTIMKADKIGEFSVNDPKATDEEIDQLFEAPEGFDEWQREKYFPNAFIEGSAIQAKLF